MSITMIACCDMNMGIGNKNNDLLFRLPKDLKFFKSATSGKICVFGRKTFESLPVKPLPKRKNYVLTSNKSYSYGGVTVVHSIDDILQLSKAHDIYICGGGEIYKQFMPYADRLLITHVHVVDFSARVFFPDFTPEEWKLIKAVKHEADDEHPHSFTFATYIRNK